MAYKRILFGTDGSPQAATTGGVAAEIAKAGKAELIVAHIWECPEAAQNVLDAAMAAATKAGVKKVKGELHGGRSPADVLVDLAEQRDVGLVVVSGGRSATEIGPTAERLSHRAPRDLLIALDVERGNGERLYRRVLIATDGSATADRAARKGFDLAASIGAPVTLAFVGHPATGRLVTDDTVAVYGAETECDIALRRGDPAVEILDVARESEPIWS